MKSNLLLNSPAKKENIQKTLSSNAEHILNCVMCHNWLWRRNLVLLHNSIFSNSFILFPRLLMHFWLVLCCKWPWQSLVLRLHAVFLHKCISPSYVMKFTHILKAWLAYILYWHSGNMFSLSFFICLFLAPYLSLSFFS